MAFLIGCSAGAPKDEPASTELIYPDQDWIEVRSAEAHGWSSKKLQLARTLSETVGSAAVMIVQGGLVIDQWGDTARKYKIHSMRKSLLSALIGIQVELGNIDPSRNLAQLGIDDNRGGLTASERGASVADLVKSRSGVYHPAAYETSSMKAGRPSRGCHEPGTHWHYNNWDFNALGTIYERASGATIFDEFQKRIAGPLQMEDFTITDFSYVGNSSSLHPAYTFRMSARDLARFGLLYLREGRWREDQIVPEDWVDESTSRHSRLGSGRGYGYMWWTGKRLFPHIKLKQRGFAAKGSGGHWLVVIPYLDLVVVHRVDTYERGLRVNRDHSGRLLRLILEAAGESTGDERSSNKEGSTSKEIAPAPARGHNYSDVGVPEDLQIKPPSSDVPAGLAGYSGKWLGVWPNSRNHLLVVEQVEREHAIVVYAQSEDSDSCKVEGRWIRAPARFVEGALVLDLQPTTLTYRMTSGGSLEAEQKRRGRAKYSLMRREP